MPQDRPPTSKLIFISYDNSTSWNYELEGSTLDIPDDFQFGPYLYQRLMYRGLPVRTYGADEAIGGAGFGENSIKVASPLIAVIEGTELSRDVLSDIETARRNNREIFVVLAGNLELPEDLSSYPLFDFRYRSNEDEVFYSLYSKLSEREYPTMRRWRFPDAEASLRQARKYFSEYMDSSVPARSKFYYRYHYMHVFADLHNKHSKIEALRDFANRQIMPSLVVAALQDDPQDVVQAMAAFALAKFPDYELQYYLYQATHRDSPNRQQTVYAKIAYEYHSNPETVQNLITDLKWLFSTETPSEFSVNQEAANSLSEDSSKLGTSEGHIFISYSHADCKELARNLALKLEAAEFNVWIDTKLEPGTSQWTWDVENAIRTASYVIPLITPKMHTSQWCKREIGVAQRLEKKIIPIIALPTETLFELEGTQGLIDNPILSENPDAVSDSLINYLRRGRSV